MSHPSDEHDIRSAHVEWGDGIHCCDLCYRSLAPSDANFIVVELRVVCLSCFERFQNEEVKPNRSFGLVKRGCYASTLTREPPPNGLGGRG